MYRCRKGNPGFGGTARWRGGALIALLVALAYLPAAGAGYIWDDDAHVTANAALRSLAGLGDIWFKLGEVQQYYPLAYSAFWVQYQLWGLAPAGYHLVNISLHAANALLLLLLLRRLEMRGAWLAAAVFALHPLQVESVAWISELKNTLSTFFYLAAMLAYLRFAPPGPPGPRGEPRELRAGDRRFYLLSLLLYLCALFSKTVTASLPAALLLIAYWKRGAVRGGEIRPLAPFIALGLAGGVLTLWVEKHLIGAQGDAWSLSLLERCLLAGRIVAFYVQKLLWPASLAFNYPRWEIDAASAWHYAPTAGVLASVSALWLLRRRVGRGPLVAALFFIGTLVPALGFFDVYPMRYAYVADHFQYLAGIGFIALATAVLVRALPPGRFTRRFAAGGLLAALALLTWSQARIYRDNETLYRDTIAKNPRSFLGHYNLAKLLDEEGRVDEAGLHYRKAAQAKPDLVEAHNNLGRLLLDEGRVDEAIGRFRRAIALAPRDLLPRRNLADALLANGKTAEALAIYGALLAAAPRDPVLHKKLGVALAAADEAEIARAHLEEAVRLAPAYADAHAALAGLPPEKGRREDAPSDQREALRFPEDPVAGPPRRAGTPPPVSEARPDGTADEARTGNLGRGPDDSDDS